MSKMNPEIKRQWVAALRSGEYRQGTADFDMIAEIIEKEF